jgi:predicted O-linked N-acetylglucosamine transferase (SPINDLY family)
MSTGRNNPCPCGSGKKYKSCCLQKEQAGAVRAPAANPALAALAGQAALHLEAGRLQQAEALCQQILRQDATHADALQYKGQIALQQGRHSEAIELLSLALSRKPQPPAILYFSRAVALQSLDRLDDAANDYRKAISLKPGLAAAHANLAHIYRDSGRPDDAIASCRLALRHQPELLAAQSMLGLLLFAQGQLAEAAASFRRELKLRPDYANTLSRLGAALQGSGNAAEAEACYRRALALQPGHADALANLTVLVLDANRLDEADALCRQALQSNGNDARALATLGDIRQQQGQLDEAEGFYRQAIGVSPGQPVTLNNLASLLFHQGRLEEAVAAARQALALNPAYRLARTSILLALQYMDSISPAELFAEHRRFAEYCEAPLKPHWRKHDNSRDPRRRLRIGYVSPDLRDHPVAHFIEPVLANHDRRKVEVYGYYTHNINDATNARLSILFDHWRPSAGLSDEALAERIRKDRIDILIDLAGHTALNSLMVFARKPAPVQMTWLGYPGTTGLDAMDYRLTDALLDPPGVTEAWHSETLLRLPASAVFSPVHDSPPVNRLPAFDAGHITLACLNNPVKISPTVLRLWARILTALPTARLLLGNVTSKASAQRLLGMFAEAGIPAERLELLPRLPLPDYLALHHRIDIALDPFPYGGGTTTLYSLWMGVPVVSLTGPTTASRHGASILARAGLPELITDSADDYVKRVVELTQDLPGLDALRQSLRGRNTGTTQTGAVDLTRALEDMFAGIWKEYCE